MKQIVRAALFAVFIVPVITTGCGKTPVSYIDEETETVSVFTEETTESIQSETDDTKSVWVYVCGAVVSPGVYELKSGSRIYEAIALAGGLTKDAVEGVINQAEPVTDGLMVAVPSLTEEGTEYEEVSDGKVNINNATAEELMTLPGIGQSKADAIISYREELGGFQTIEQLMEITGIKEGVYSKIKELIKV